MDKQAYSHRQNTSWLTASGKGWNSMRYFGQEIIIDKDNQDLEVNQSFLL